MSEMMRSSGANEPDHGTSRGKLASFRPWCLWLATTAGLVCAIGTWGLGGIVISVIVVAVATAVVVSSTLAGDGRGALRKIVSVSLAAGLIAPAAVGLIAVLKLAGVLIVLILAATTPAVTSFVRARRNAAQASRPVVPPKPAVSHEPATSSSDDSAAAKALELTSLDDEALCLAWRRSYRLLENARTAVERLSVVQQRQQYLDELQRRSPEGLTAWLAAGARASGNPLPYVDNARRRAG